MFVILLFSFLLKTAHLDSEILKNSMEIALQLPCACNPTPACWSSCDTKSISLHIFLKNTCHDEFRMENPVYKREERHVLPNSELHEEPENTFVKTHFFFVFQKEHAFQKKKKKSVKICFPSKTSLTEIFSHLWQSFRKATAIAWRKLFFTSFICSKDFQSPFWGTDCYFLDR